MIKVIKISAFYSFLCYLICLVFSFCTQNNLLIESFFIIASILCQVLNFSFNKTSKNWFSFIVQAILFSIFFTLFFLLTFLFIDIKSIVNSVFFSVIILFIINVLISIPVIFLILKIKPTPPCNNHDTSAYKCSDIRQSD